MLEDNKPWYASQTVWGAVIAILSSIGGAYYAYKTQNFDAVVTSLSAALGGVLAFIGRFKATATVGKAVVGNKTTIKPN